MEYVKVTWPTSDQLDPGLNPGTGKVFFYFLPKCDKTWRNLWRSKLERTARVELESLHFSCFNKHSSRLLNTNDCLKTAWLKIWLLEILKTYQISDLVNWILPHNGFLHAPKRVQIYFHLQEQYSNIHERNPCLDSSVPELFSSHGLLHWNQCKVFQQIVPKNPICQMQMKSVAIWFCDFFQIFDFVLHRQKHDLKLRPIMNSLQFTEGWNSFFRSIEIWIHS